MSMGISRKNIYILVTLAFVSVSTGGIVSMHTDDMGQMTACPFTVTSAICHMSVFEHIGTFQNMFLGMPIKIILLSLLLTILVLSFPIASSNNNGPPNAFRFSIRTYYRFPDINFNRLLLALSDGRLQPKLYA